MAIAIPIIRPYRAGDEHGICAAHIAAIQQLCTADYPPDIIAVWSGLTPGGYLDSMAKNNERFHVLDDNGTIAGFSGWFGEELWGFYLHPAYAGQGLGRMLYEFTEADYRAVTGNDGWEFNSTLTARPFYKKMGCTELHLYDRTFARAGKTATMQVARMSKKFAS